MVLVRCSNLPQAAYTRANSADIDGSAEYEVKPGLGRQDDVLSAGDKGRHSSSSCAHPCANSRADASARRHADERAGAGTAPDPCEITFLVRLATPAFVCRDDSAVLSAHFQRSQCNSQLCRSPEASGTLRI